MTSHPAKLITCLAVLTILSACSTTSEEMMPVSECEQGYWKERAMAYQQKSEEWQQQARAAQEQVQIEREKNTRMMQEYNSCFRK